MPVLYEPPTVEAICAMVEGEIGQAITHNTVYAVRRLLRGIAHGDGKRGPTGVAYTILSRPSGTTAAILRAHMKLGGIVAFPPGDDLHDPAAWFMAHVVAYWLPLPSERTAAFRAHLRDLLSLDPLGQTLPGPEWLHPDQAPKAKVAKAA